MIDWKSPMSSLSTVIFLSHSVLVINWAQDAYWDASHSTTPNGAILAVEKDLYLAN